MYYKAMEFAESTVRCQYLRSREGLRSATTGARIMELFEDDGLVGPPKGAGKPRDFIRRSH